MGQCRVLQVAGLELGSEAWAPEPAALHKKIPRQLQRARVLKGQGFPPRMEGLSNVIALLSLPTSI